MPMYVIYNRKTGEPVHTHFEPEDVKTSQEGLFSMVEPSYDRSLLKVTLVYPKTVSVGDSYQIDSPNRKVGTPKKRDGCRIWCWCC